MTKDARILEVKRHVRAELVPLTEIHHGAGLFAVIAVARGGRFWDWSLVEAVVAGEVAAAGEVDVGGREGRVVGGAASTSHPPLHLASPAAARG